MKENNEAPCVDCGDQNKPRIFIACPGNRFSNNFLNSWTNLIMWIVNNGYVFTSNIDYSSLIQTSRDKVMGTSHNSAQPFNGKFEFDYMLLIDSDMTFHPKDLENLLSRNVPVVSGIYRIKPDDSWSAWVGGDDGLVPSEGGGGNWINDEYVENHKDQMVQGDFGGLGWCLIKKEVFAKLTPPLWFDDKADKNYGEDVVFFRKIKAAGYDINFDLSVKLGHEKTFIFS
jgi:hypothetical protein